MSFFSASFFCPPVIRPSIEESATQQETNKQTNNHGWLCRIHRLEPALSLGLWGVGNVRNLEFQKQARNAPAICIGLGTQFLILPAIGFLVVKILQLPKETGIMLLVSTTSPGGSYSNWWCSLFNAEFALSVTMTTLSTLLSVICCRPIWCCTHDGRIVRRSSNPPICRP